MQKRNKHTKINKIDNKQKYTHVGQVSNYRVCIKIDNGEMSNELKIPQEKSM